MVKWNHKNSNNSICFLIIAKYRIFFFLNYIDFLFSEFKKKKFYPTIFPYKFLKSPSNL